MEKIQTKIEDEKKSKIAMDKIFGQIKSCVRKSANLNAESANRVFEELTELAEVVIESVKAASDILAPIDGEITEVNAALEDNPGLVNEDPTGNGWFFKMTIGNASELEELMDEAAYKAFAESES